MASNLKNLGQLFQFVSLCLRVKKRSRKITYDLLSLRGSFAKEAFCARARIHNHNLSAVWTKF